MILLITGCINVDEKTPYVFLKDSEKRLEEYKKTIKWALSKTAFDKVVFCENSNFNLDINEFSTLANYKHKKFEYLTFKGDNKKITTQGKGYGEGEITEFFIKNSLLLKNEDYFYKLTGRLQILNINKITKNKPKNYFMNRYLNGQVDTRFYCVSKKTYINKLLNTYKKVNDSAGYYLEHAFFDDLTKVNYRSFRIKPLFYGISGSTGRIYNDKNSYIKNILCFFNIYNNRIFWKFKNIIKAILNRKKN